MPNAIDLRATEWAVRVDAGALTPSDEAALDAWTQADVRHAGAFARAMAANAYFDRAAALGAQDVTAMADHDHASVTPLRRATAEISRRAWIGGAASALAASLVVAVGLSRWRTGERISVPLGSVRRVALDDGSAVTLNTSAEIAVRMEAAVRRVDLLAGEVNFDVAKDRARPFVVAVDGALIRVVGTSFNVRRLEDDALAVTVREGIVEVVQGESPPVRLVAGDHLVLARGAAPRRERLPDVEVERIGLWQRGEIDLTGMTLGDAAREYARYSDRRIVIPDESVARLKVAGVFSTSDPAGFARAAALAQDLRVEQRADGLAIVR